jgi:hypothetical protein
MKIKCICICATVRRKRKHCPKHYIFNTKYQSEVENAMIDLGYNTTQYWLSFVNVDLSDLFTTLDREPIKIEKYKEGFHY